MSAFWDASALAHVCVPGQISRKARELVRSVPLVVWWATSLEVGSALRRVQREGGISETAVRASRERLAELLHGCTVVPPMDVLKELALIQIDRFPLKTGDALQLAAALVWCRQKPRGRWFVCNDRQLGAAALATGFTVESV